MPTFRFRAAAALELRHQQERAAAVVLARAEAALQHSRDARGAAETTRLESHQALGDHQARGIDGLTLEWHRNWISRLGAAVTRLDGDIEGRLAVMRTAERAWHDARRKRLALERLRDRAWRKFQAAEAHRERQIIDELARLRFTLGVDEFGACAEPSKEDES